MHDSQLSESTRELLRQAKGDGASSASRDALWQKLSAEIGPSMPPPAAAAGSVAGGVPAWGVVALVLSIAGAYMVSRGGPVSGHDGASSRPVSSVGASVAEGALPAAGGTAPSAEVREASRPEVGRIPVAPLPSDGAPPRVFDPSGPARPTGRTVGHIAPREIVPAVVSSAKNDVIDPLAREVELLEQARRAVARGDKGAALRAIEERRRLSSGQLATEAEELERRARGIPAAPAPSAMGRAP